MATSTIKPWYKVYDGDKECRFFKELSRNKKYQWRSTKALAKAANLKEAEVEEIAQKYVQSGQVIQSSQDPEKWAYFERIATEKKEKSSISVENKKKRIADASASTSSP